MGVLGQCVGHVKRLLKRTPFYGIYLRLKPKPDFDPFDYEFKRRTILDYTSLFGCKTLVETGTCEGGTVAALEGSFDRVISIELDQQLATRAAIKFEHLPHVTILQGSSDKLFEAIIPSLDGPALFWLDAHYSGSYINKEGDLIETACGESNTPLFEELDFILRHYRFPHVILIDDARELGRGDYPSQRRLRELVQRSGHALDFRIEKDIIRIAPRT